MNGRTIRTINVAAGALWVVSVSSLIAIIVLLATDHDAWARGFFGVELLAVAAANVISIRAMLDDHCEAIKDAYRLGREDGRGGRGGRDGSDGSDGGVRSLSSR